MLVAPRPGEYTDSGPVVPAAVTLHPPSVMSDRFAEVRLETTLQEETRPVALPLEERAFCIAVLGDFSGRGSRGADRAGAPDPVALPIDRDDFDAVLARVAPTLHLQPRGADAPIELRFGELDDFHPDGLFERLPLFRELRELRARLADPATFRRAAAELRGDAAPAPSPPPAAVAADGLLDRILDVSAPAAVGPGAGGVPVSETDFRSYVRRILAPHLVAEPDPRQAETIARVDAVTGEQMRAILHHPEFQALESLWRAVFLLVRRLPTGVFLRLYLIDVTRDELRADLLEGGTGRTPLRGLLTAGPERGTRGPWSLLVGGYSFGPGADDVELLRALAALAAGAGAPWISAADPSLVGCPDPAALAEPESWEPPAGEWEALRREPDARWLGLAMPRILLRLPYGEDADECERFRFEESDGAPGHEEYLWGNPALGCALLLGQAFAGAGWALRPGAVREIEGLPLHVVREGGEASVKPCAEAWLTDRAAARILEAGVMPFASRKDRDAAQLVRFQSVAHPPAALAGPWT
jgi:type VI secretion system protein ImpC